MLERRKRRWKSKEEDAGCRGNIETEPCNNRTEEKERSRGKKEHTPTTTLIGIMRIRMRMRICIGQIDS